MTIVRIKHADELRYCRKGIRLFCKKYGHNYHDFIKNGVDSEELIAIGDSMANELVKIAKAEEENGK